MTQNKSDINGVKGKNGRVHPINVFGWPSKIFHDLLKFRWNPFLHLPENLLLDRSILLCLFKMFFCYQTIDRVFLKTLQKSIFVNSCFFSYFHVFGEEPLNAPESVCEKTLLVKIHLQVWIFIYQDNFFNWWKLTFLYLLFSKFRENIIWRMKAKSAISAKTFFRKTHYGLCIEIDNSAYFWRRHNIFHKNSHMKKAPEFNRIFRYI